MIHKEGRFTGSAQRSIYYQGWRPEISPRAVLLLVHGAGEHSGRYRALAGYFTGHDYAVVALDHNGHGYSEGRRGHVDDCNDYLQDLGSLHQLVKEQFPGVPVFLLGHSLGGLIGSLYLLQHQQEFAGAVLSGAAIKTELEPGPLQMMLIRLLALLMPALGILKLDASGVSRDPAVVREYMDDPLVHHGKMSVRKLRELFAGMTTLRSGAAGLRLPMLILHGGDDRMTAAEGSRFLYEHISCADKTLKIYPGLYHEIFNEPERAEVLAEVLAWCDARLL